MAVQGKPGERQASSGGERKTLAFIDHHRQRSVDQVSIAYEGEFLIGDYHEDGSVDSLGEFKIQLHHLGDRGGLLHPQLCIFDDGTNALAVLLDHADGDLGRVLRPVASREEFSFRLIAFGLRDASDLPSGEGT